MTVPSRDVEINLIANDRTGRATRSAARNLEQLARKVQKAQTGNIGTKDKVVVDSEVKVDNNRVKKAFDKAGAVAGQSFRQRLQKFLGPSGFDGDFSRAVRNVPNLFGAAGQRARTAFRNKFGSPGLDAEFVRDIKSIPGRFSTAGTRARNAFRRAFTLGPAGLDPQFVADARRIGAVFGRAGRNARTQFANGLGRLTAVRSRLGQVFRVNNAARRGGITAGSVFFRAFINTVTLGTAGGQLSAGMIKAAPKMAAVGATLGGVVAAVMVTEIAQALSAAASLFIGGGLLAGPIAFMLAQQAKASKETEAQVKRVAALRKRLDNATNKDTRARIQKQLAGEERVLEELRKQSQQWDNIKSRAKGFMQFISAPLQLPLQRAIHEMFVGFNNLKGPVREVMTALGTALPGLTKGIFASFLSFINALKPALPNIVAGLNEWGQVMPQITASVGNFIARLTSHPEAVQGFADSFDTFLGSAGDVIVKLQSLASTYGQFEAAIRGGRTGQWGDEWTKTSGKVGVAARDIGQSQLFILRKYDDFLQSIRSVPGSPFDKLKNDTHQARLKMEAEFAAMTAAKHQMDLSLSEGSKIAGLKNAINVLRDFRAKTKKALNDPSLSKTKRIKLEADLTRFNLQMATAKAELHILQKTRSRPKLEADKSRLERTIKSANAQLKKTNDRKTIAKVKADKKQAEAALAQVNARLNALNGKEAKASIVVTTHYRTTGTSAQAHFLKQAKIHASADAGGWQGAAGPTWQAALAGGAGSRTGGPTQVSVEAPIVNTRVLLDSREIAAQVRSIVVDENKRSAHRARVGRRP